jgi:hypothetical protein
MNNFGNFHANQNRARVAPGLTCVLPLWNHRKTVAVCSVSGERFPNHGVERSNFCAGTFVR